MDIDAKDLVKALYKMEEVDKTSAQKIYDEHRKKGVPILDACIAGGVREEAVLYAIGQQLGVETVQLDGMVLPPAIISLVEAHAARNYEIIPYKKEGNVLVVATARPDDLSAMDELKFLIGVEQVRPALCSKAQIERALDQYYKEVKSDQALDSWMKKDEQKIVGSGRADELVHVIEDLEKMDLSDAAMAAESAPVRKLLDLVLLTAIKAQASDVHFEPFEDAFKVRNRVDGVLYDMLPVPKSLSGALVARVKVMSGLDIAERRMPQDGKISVSIGGRAVDLRVSTLPTMFGESVVIRVLDRSVVSLDLDKIGMPGQSLEHFREIIHKPNGIVVVTGPTGSGKTTTLYAALNEANDESVKVITTEDPVEYEIDGLIQVQIDEDIDRSFSKCLRSILRQDPDKILVGEIRDLETAKIAIEASLTGHIVFTTLHTNDAPTAITRLLDMGLEPFLVAATLEVVIAQRLVRTICTQCKAPYQPSPEELMMLNLTPERVAGQNFYYGKHCERCNRTGYKGRTAVFEIMDIDERMREIVLAKGSASQIRSQAVRNGMASLRDAGINKIFQGVTTIEEVVRETLATEE